MKHVHQQGLKVRKPGNLSDKGQRLDIPLVLSRRRDGIMGC